MIPILTAQAIPGLTIVPDRYRRLISRDGSISQVGVSGIEWSDLFTELDKLDRPEWIKQNVIDYKISIMLMDAGMGEFYG